jgi:hypothetical protein
MPGPNKGQSMPIKNTWKPLHEVVKDLREKSFMWFLLGNSELAETYHEKANDISIQDWLENYEKGSKK